MNKIIYLDAAATYQKSGAVIGAQVDFLQNHYANSGRGICARAVYVDDMLARARRRVADFMGGKEQQIVFTSGTTGAINMIARMLDLSAEKKVVVSDLDHHSARLPFEASLAQIGVMPLDADFNIDVNNIPSADVIVLTAMSNVLGVPQKIPELVRIARVKNPNVIVVVDAAQYVVHNKINVADWDADFVVWSGHKIGADTGVGVMYIKNPENFNPVNFGGGMVNRILDNELILMDGPEKFEAGTLPLSQISGMAMAIDELENNRPNLNLIKYMYDELHNIPRIKILSSRDAAVLTFVVDGMHVLDFGASVGARGLCLRVGNMCATWVHRALGVQGSIRLSIGAYNTWDDKMMFTKDNIIDALKKIYDPEIPVNIWDMGLIYDIDIKPELVTLKMTFTSPTCPMMEELMEQVRQGVQAVVGNVPVRVDLVWDPPWDLSRMSDAARLELDLTNEGW